MRGDAFRDVPDLERRYDLAADVRPAGARDDAVVDELGNRIDAELEGVVHERLREHVDYRGSLMEVVNFDHPFWDEPVVYSYCFTIRPGRIKGWGMHRQQADRYFVCSGDVRVVLYDGRVNSPTYGRFAQFIFSDSARGLLLIPPGVWHADQNWGEADAVVVNFPTRPYDREGPDKYRLDPHGGAIPFDWTLRDR